MREVKEHTFHLLFKVGFFLQKELWEAESLSQVIVYIIINSCFQQFSQNFSSTKANKCKANCIHNYYKSCWCPAVSTCTAYSSKSTFVSRGYISCFCHRKGVLQGWEVLQTLKNPPRQQVLITTKSFRPSGKITSSLMLFSFMTVTCSESKFWSIFGNGRKFDAEIPS